MISRADVLHLFIFFSLWLHISASVCSSWSVDVVDGAGKLPELRLQAGNAGGGGAVQPGVEQWGRKAAGQRRSLRL